jgi:hypothetical protein
MTSWKTTLFGALSAVCVALSAIFPAHSEILLAIGAVFTALTGYFAKDKDTTGVQ